MRSTILRKSFFSALAVLLLAAAAPVRAHDEHGIPAFDASPAITSRRSGAWSSRSTWSEGRVPTASDVVHIAPGHIVLLDADASARVVGIASDATLTAQPFLGSSSRTLALETLQVHTGGTLEVASAILPLPAAQTVRFIFRDTPLDPAASDPEQMGHGLIVAGGKVRIWGAAKTPFLRLAQEALSGQDRLVFTAAPQGWRAGDRLALPDTRQIEMGWTWWYNNARGRTDADFRWEEATVRSVSGNVVTLSSPLRFDHRGARDSAGTLRALPHIANLSRNVSFASANPSGVRGHAILTEGTTTNLNWCAFAGMGRTTVEPLGATNQVGRYGLHIHQNEHGLDSAGFAGYVRGVVVDGSPRWGMALHGTDSFLVQDTIAYNCAGAGFVTEDGSESFNVFERCFALRSLGYHGSVTDRNPSLGFNLSDTAFTGDGFWFRAGRNTVRNCVASGGTGTGFAYWSYAGPTVRLPLAPGDSREVAGQYRVAVTGYNQVPFGAFRDNEVYGATDVGLLGGALPDHLFERLTAWHVKLGWQEFLSGNVLLKDSLFIGDPTQINALANPPAGMIADGGGATFGTALLQGGEFHNLVDISVRY